MFLNHKPSPNLFSDCLRWMGYTLKIEKKTELVNKTATLPKAGSDIRENPHDIPHYGWRPGGKAAGDSVPLLLLLTCRGHTQLLLSVKRLELFLTPDWVRWGGTWGLQLAKQPECGIQKTQDPFLPFSMTSKG